MADRKWGRLILLAAMLGNTLTAGPDHEGHEAVVRHGGAGRPHYLATETTQATQIKNSIRGSGFTVGTTVKTETQVGGQAHSKLLYSGYLSNNGAYAGYIGNGSTNIIYAGYTTPTVNYTNPYSYYTNSSYSNPYSYGYTNPYASTYSPYGTAYNPYGTTYNPYASTTPYNYSTWYNPYNYGGYNNGLGTVGGYNPYAVAPSWTGYGTSGYYNSYGLPGLGLNFF